MLWNHFFCCFFLFFSHFLESNDWIAYIADANSATVIPFNLTTHTPLAPIAVGSAPICIAITRDAKTVYVVNNDASSVTPIHVETNRAGASIPVGLYPSSIALSPLFTGLENSISFSEWPIAKTAYVVNSGDNTVTPIDMESNRALQPILVGPQPFCICLDRYGYKAYVANHGDNTISVIDTKTGTVEKTIPAGAHISAMTITPDGSMLYATNLYENTILSLDLENCTLGNLFPVGNRPVGIACARDGKKAYVINEGEKSITVLDLTSKTPSVSIALTTTPFAIALAPDDKTAYVTSPLEGTLTSINLISNQIQSVFSVAASAFGLAITPDQPPVASFTATNAKLGSPILCDASSSYSPVGTIVSYHWNFGDRSENCSVTTSNPVVRHTYRKDGKYRVTLSVTNSAGTTYDSETFTGQMMTNSAGESAVCSRSVVIEVDSPTKPPSKFIGTVEPYRNGRFIKYKVLTNWKKSSSPGVVYYEIFADDKRIAVIPHKQPSLFSIEGRCRSATKDAPFIPDISQLKKKYQIRSVTFGMNKSPFIPLTIKQTRAVYGRNSLHKQ